MGGEGEGWIPPPVNFFLPHQSDFQRLQVLQIYKYFG